MVNRKFVGILGGVFLVLALVLTKSAIDPPATIESNVLIILAILLYILGIITLLYIRRK